MLGDEERGLNYELAMALAPSQTQLLLLSGSVANPQQIVKWFERLGRRAVLVRHDERPVPLEEASPSHFNFRLPSSVKGYWPRFVANALAANLGPILIFAPRRQATEKLAAELSRLLPPPANPLSLREDQEQICGEAMARLLRNRVAYHHSGLSYAARAGVIEPLAKAGQLRVVVATMGLAAGINFSLRSVALAGDSYRRNHVEYPLRADEILQMFGRAGRRGIDETGYVLISANQIRMRESYPTQLARSGLVDWGALLGLMTAAAEQGKEPFAEAVRVQERLFTTKPIFLGVEQSLKNPNMPCGLMTDPERARFVRKKTKQMLNSRGEWEPWPEPAERALQDIKLGPPASSAPGAPAQLRSILSEPEALDKIGHGVLVRLHEDEHGQPVHGRASTIAEVCHDERLLLAKWVRRLTRWKGRQTNREVWEFKVLPLIEDRLAAQGTPVVRVEESDRRIRALVSLGGLTRKVPVDRHGVALWNPVSRQVLPSECAGCRLQSECRNLSPSSGVAMLWRRLGLVDEQGVPTRRGRVVSFFAQGNGLAIAAGLEDDQYPLEELIYDLANLDAGFRFCSEENRFGGRLALACHERFDYHNITGYLENGLPPDYGSGAEQVVASVHKNPLNKNGWINQSLGSGDIDRVIIEWRSLLRQIMHSPDLEWPRWMELKRLARAMLNETESPTLTDLPPLDYHQSKRMEHRLVLKRH
jgi:hypothetical protein